MAGVKDVLKLAASQIGVKESPAGSNKVKYSKEYGYAAAWCAMFIWWLFRKLDAAGLYYAGKKTAYTPTLLSWYKKKGLTGSKPKVGALVFFNWGGRAKGVPEHVGIVEKIINASTIQTIEGNTSTGSQSNGGQVMRRHRSTRSVVAYAYPKYTTSTAKPGTAAGAKSGTNTVKVPGFPLPKGFYYGPASGPDESVSGLVKRRDGITGAGLKVWQQRMKTRGWHITPDGQYGPQTAKIARQFQTEKHLSVDGLIGPETWAAAWTTPIT